MTVAVLAPKRILVVDDDLGLVRLWKLGLQSAGWQVETATSLAEAREVIATKGKPHAVVADIHLPNGDGRHLREDLAGVPFVIISGYADEVPDLAKPFSLERLKAAVLNALQRGF